MLDPYSDSVAKFPAVNADIVVVSHNHSDHNNFSAIGGTSVRPAPFVVDGPGEYEVAGATILGFASFHDGENGKDRGKNTIYLIKIDKVTLVHLGDLGGPISDSVLEEINGVDILMVPVGGKVTLDSKEARGVVGKIQPKIIIPMHYKLPKFELKVDLDPVEDFVKEMGYDKVEPQDKLLTSHDKLPEDTELIVLNAKR